MPSQALLVASALPWPMSRAMASLISSSELAPACRRRLRYLTVPHRHSYERSTHLKHPSLGGVFISAGDIDGDGMAEIAISPDQGGGPRVRIFRGGRLHPDWPTTFGIKDMNFFGGVRTTIADINGDGFGDLIVAAGFGGGPRIAIYRR